MHEKTEAEGSWTPCSGPSALGKNPRSPLPDRLSPLGLTLSDPFHLGEAPRFGGGTFTGARTPQRWPSDNNCPHSSCSHLCLSLGWASPAWSGPGWLKCCITAKGNTRGTEPLRIWAAWVASLREVLGKQKENVAAPFVTAQAQSRTLQGQAECALCWRWQERVCFLVWVSFLLPAKPPAQSGNTHYWPLLFSLALFLELGRGV